MKLSKGLKLDFVVPPEEWECLDNCPVCRLIKRRLTEGKQISKVEFEKAFAEAEAEIDAV